MKRIALIGGTGKTGREFLKKALDEGFMIQALARDPKELSHPGHDHLAVIGGDVLVAEDVRKVLKDTEAVVSLFGHRKNSPEWLQTDGTRNILNAMDEYGIERILSLSGGGLPFPEKDEPRLIDKLIRGVMKLAVPKILNDAVKHAELLRASGKDWTIIRGPRLTEGEEKGQYRVGWVGVESGTQISRADLADFILKELNEGRYIRQMPFVSY